MWPRKIPFDVKENILRKTECDVYSRLESVLDDSFTVFYSRPWLGLTPSGEEIDGECDFVVAHREYGIIALEVKGGAITYDPETESWKSQDRWGFHHSIKNPVKQARDSKYHILDKLKKYPHWHQRRIGAHHGIIFPHSVSPGKDLGMDMPLKIFCFSERFSHDLQGWIMEMFSGNSQRENPLGNDGIQALEHLLAQPFQLKLSLTNILAQDERFIDQLTQQQFQILQAIRYIPKAGISGAAGTGKTVLAMEEAVRCTESGMKTLLVCFNNPLSLMIRENVKKYPEIDVFTFHEFCASVAGEAGIPLPSGLSTKDKFKYIYPEILLQGLDALPEKRYQAIIVDEGQDFLPDWWVALDSALDTKKQSLLRVFFDSNQKVYSNASTLPTDVQVIQIPLNQNIRNTQNIQNLASLFYRGIPVKAAGPEGLPVEWITTKSLAHNRQAISTRIAALTGEEKVKPGEIAVLASNQNNLASIQDNGKIAGYPVLTSDKINENFLIGDTIRRFKGLERSLVILSLSLDLLNNLELIYVGLTRPRTKLIIVGPQEIMDFLKDSSNSS